MFYERTDIRLTNVINEDYKAVFATIDVDLSVEYVKVLEAVGATVIVDFGGNFGDFFIPQNLQTLADGLSFTQAFSFANSSAVVAKAQASRWHAEIRYRIKAAILSAMANAHEVLSETSVSDSSSSSTYALSASIYTSEVFSRSSVSDTDSSISTDSSSSGFPVILGSVIELTLTNVRGNICVSLYHDIGYVDQRKLGRNQAVYINYSGVFNGVRITAGTAMLKDKLSVEIALSYNSQTYNTTVVAVQMWYRSVLRQISRALNNLV